jgi:hypothetical protein
MSTATLYTARNYSLLARLAQAIHEAEVSEQVRDVLLLVLSSAVASCSRLIAYRDNMTGGGPAWTVPGFWVPPRHLERNPLHHLSARFQKVMRGLLELSCEAGIHRPTVYLGDSEDRLNKLARAGTKVDYIFTDPPYGDSVPFLEFSQIWNCWDKRGRPVFDREVVVSDRAEPKSDWKEYEQRLGRILQHCSRVLAPKGHLTLTFNNLDIRAWHALLQGVQQARLKCIDVAYQMPAVVSAKASFAPASSYLGDVYATFAPAPADFKPRPWSVVEARLSEAADLRAGAISRVTQLKVAALSILELNVAASCILELHQQFAALPGRTPMVPDHSPLFRIIREAIRQARARSASLSDAQLCGAVVAQLPAWLGLDQHEILDIARRCGLPQPRPRGQRPDRLRHRGD